MSRSKLITPKFGAITDVGEASANPARSDELLQERTIGGPLAAKDVRMYLDAATLRHLLEVAESSSIKRVQIDGVGVRIRLWRGTDGHLFETWQLVGHQPRAETCALIGGSE
jgi:hypothetical protein